MCSSTIFSVYKRKFWPDISTRWKVTEPPESLGITRLGSWIFNCILWQFQQYTLLWTKVLDWPIHITFPTPLIWQKTRKYWNFHTALHQYIINTTPAFPKSNSISGLSIHIKTHCKAVEWDLLNENGLRSLFTLQSAPKPQQQIPTGSQKTARKQPPQHS